VISKLVTPGVLHRSAPSTPGGGSLSCSGRRPSCAHGLPCRPCRSCGPPRRRASATCAAGQHVGSGRVGRWRGNGHGRAACQARCRAATLGLLVGSGGAALTTMSSASAAGQRRPGSARLHQWGTQSSFLRSAACLLCVIIRFVW
jgi:hypothetical protein